MKTTGHTPRPSSLKAEGRRSPGGQSICQPGTALAGRRQSEPGFFWVKPADHPHTRAKLTVSQNIKAKLALEKKVAPQANATLASGSDPTELNLLARLQFGIRTQQSVRFRVFFKVCANGPIGGRDDGVGESGERSTWVSQRKQEEAVCVDSCGE